MNLTVGGLRAGYGGGIVLHGVDLTVAAGTVGAVLGRNGVGKTTLVHAIAGLIRPKSGSVEFDGVPLAGRAAHRIARTGVALVPQGRRVFAPLTVGEHLALAGRIGMRRQRSTSDPLWTATRVLEMFPPLRARLGHRGGQLSGGEAQLLAIARALLTQPRLLLLDEACEGLAGDLAARIRDVIAELAESGMTVLLVEQQPRYAVDLATRVTVLDNGRVVLDQPAEEARADLSKIEALLGLSGS